MDANGENGIEISEASFTTIGHANSSLGNRIGGAVNSGVSIEDATGTIVRNNSIAKASSPSAIAVLIDGATTNTIVYENTIRTHQNGIVVRGATNDNQFWANEIYLIDLKAIDLNPGSQDNVNPPVVTSASFTGMLAGTASQSALVQLYADGDDQGQLYLDTVRANADGNWTYSLRSGQIQAMQGDSLLNLTALQDSSASTSEFSIPFGVDFDADSVVLVPLSVTAWCYESNQTASFTGSGPRFGASTAVRLIGVSTVDVNDTIILTTSIGTVEGQLEELNITVDSSWAQGT